MEKITISGKDFIDVAEKINTVLQCEEFSIPVNICILVCNNCINFTVDCGELLVVYDVPAKVEFEKSKKCLIDVSTFREIVSKITDNHDIEIVAGENKVEIKMVALQGDNRCETIMQINPSLSAECPDYREIVYGKFLSNRYKAIIEVSKTDLIEADKKIWENRWVGKFGIVRITVFKSGISVASVNQQTWQTWKSTYKSISLNTFIRSNPSGKVVSFFLKDYLLRKALDSINDNKVIIKVLSDYVIVKSSNPYENIFALIKQSPPL
jgi:selenophosphate synthetase-related protein